MVSNFFLILTLCSFSLISWGKTNIWVGKIKGIETLPSRLAEGVRKNTILLSSKVPESELHLSHGPGHSSPNAIEVESEFIKTSSKWKIFVRLKKKGLVKREEKFEEVNESDLLRVHENALQRVLIEIPKEVVPPVQQPPGPQTLNSPAPPRKRLVRNKIKPSVINFKKRISDLQSDTDESVEEKAEEIEEAKSSKAANQVKNVASAQSSVSNPETKSVQAFPVQKSLKRNLPIQTSVGVVYRQDIVKTESIITTEAKPAFFGLKMNGEAYRPKEWLAFIYDVSMLRPVKVEVETQQLYLITLGLDFSMRDWNFGLSGARTDEIFYNIQEDGAGLTSGVVSPTWGELFFSKKLIMKNRPWKAGISYASLFSGSSSWSELKDFNGSRIRASIGSSALWENTTWSIIFENTEISATGSVPFRSQSTRYNFQFAYTF